MSWSRWLALTGVGALVIVLGFIGFSLIRGEAPWGVDGECGEAALSCGALIELVSTVLVFAVAVAAFLFVRVHWVAYRYVRAAAGAPARLVPSATRVPEGVVGRDGLCDVLEGDLCQATRPQIIVGGVGTGKTATLVRLTERLAEKGAVPVPINLANAPHHELHFRELAKVRFVERAERWASSTDEAERIWRKLCETGRVVVLADGLDELVTRTVAPISIVKPALGEATEDPRLPLVIASRPNEVLQELNAAFVELEPVPANVAVDYIVDAGDEEQRGVTTEVEVAKLVTKARVMERPLYLRVAQTLHKRGELRDLNPNSDVLELRIELLRRWIERFRQATPWDASSEEPEKAMDGLEKLACAALIKKSTEIDFDDIEEISALGDASELRENEDAVRRIGERLELVEVLPKGVRFRDTLVQAYLGAGHIAGIVREPKPHAAAFQGDGTSGSGLLDRLRHMLPGIRNGAPERESGEESDEGEDFLDTALRRPSRELLTSLIICCEREAEASSLGQDVQSALHNAAEPNEKRSAAATLELIAAAYQVDKIVARHGTTTLGQVTTSAWKKFPRPLDPIAAKSLPMAEAKLRAIARIAESGGEDAYRTLWAIGELEDNYRVRLDAAQRFAGGSADASSVLAAAELNTKALRSRLAAGGAKPADVRLGCMYAWTLPRLASEIEGEGQPDIAAELEAWVKSAEGGTHLGVEACLAQGFKWEANQRPREGADPLRRGQLFDQAKRLLESSKWWYSEIALLQAFALWCLGATDSEETDPEAADKVIEVLKRGRARARHPFVQATARMCEKAVAVHRSLRSGKEVRPGQAQPSSYLWIDEVEVAAKIGARPSRPRQFAITTEWVTPAMGWRALDPRARQLVGDILLLLNLIERGQVTNADAHPVSVLRQREQRRSRAQKQGPELPTCFGSGKRVRCLAVNVGKEIDERAVGSNCNCEYELCPYPAESVHVFRGELRETFCRAQQRLLVVRRGWWLNRGFLPPWQGRNWASRVFLRRRHRQRLLAFWEAMEHRAKG